ncbi:MAG: DNA translocase FtsK 4TM domain-containing protein, partial [Gemmataceae bacterium]
MPDRRHWRLYLSALVLLVGGAYLTLSVLDSVSAEKRIAAKPNRLGSLGGAIAYELRHSLGTAVYVFLGGWFVVVVRLALRRSWLRWSLRSLGWLLLIPTAAVLAERWPKLAPAGAVLPLGPGGSIGAWINDWLQDRLQPLGQDLLLVGCLALGVILTLDDALRLLMRLLWWCLRANLDLPVIEKRPAPQRGIPLIVRTIPTAEAEEVEETEEEETPAPEASESDEPAIGAKIIPIHHHNEIVRHEMQGPHLFTAPRRKPPTQTVSDRERFADFELPSLKLLEDAQPFDYHAHDHQLRDRAA